ncbi:MAG TPA: serine--tRNA ligase [Candidatus Nanopelagicaceae bacterium]|nr:serine--tRNA ligase [Candidatus Nanopelagicaceae bacterium]
MRDIEDFRANIDAVIETEKKRFKNPKNAEKVLEFDLLWRNVLQEIQDLRKQRNDLSNEISQNKKSGEQEKANNAIEKSKQIKETIDELEKKKIDYLEEREKFRYIVGNDLHKSVPIGETEESNAIIREYGEIPIFDFKPSSHVNIIQDINGADTKKASEVVGSRFYYLKGDIVLLNLALIRFALDKLISKGYEPLWTPFFIKHEVMKAAAELADFEEQLYKIHDEDIFMIATSEQTLAAYHYDEIIDPDLLPLKYAGVSSCFRREAGSHGKDTLGIFRVHQFEKVEQYIFCKPENSWVMFDELISNAEEIYRELEIPYRIVNIASGELNDNAAQKYDLEAWFPASGNYRELGSCSNCLDYQARKLKVRMGKVGSTEKKEIAHTLNCTAIATERTICCILENFQNKDGTVSIPKVLQKYMNGKKVLNS